MENLDQNQSILNYEWQDKVFLVAEDVEINYLFLEQALKKTNVQILWAVNGKQAVDICKTTNQIDLILTDLQMPEMDGFEATRIIREGNGEIPIIAYTAYAYEGVREKILLAGANECLIKPFEPKKLLLTIRKYLFVS